MRELTDIERGILKNLHHRLWSKDRRAVGDRKIPRPEWELVCDLIRECALPCEMHSTSWGFSIGMAIYAHAPYPGTPPESVLFVDIDNLPESVLPEENVRGRYAKGFELLKEFTHSLSNCERLKFYNLAPSRDMTHYEY